MLKRLPHILWFLCLLVLFPLVSGAQFTHRESVHICNHFCSEAKIGSSKTGIYPQDPRVHFYDVLFYGLDIEVDPWSTTIKGAVHIRMKIIEPDTWELVLELMQDLKVSRVLIDGIEVSFQHQNNVIEVFSGEAIASGTLLDVEVFYAGEPQPDGFFSGIQSAVNSFGDPVLWTLSEPHNARQWFPVKQVLADKADSVYVFITCPEGFIAASNGLLSGITPMKGGKLRYEWISHYPIAYYLISMAVANYQEYSFMAPLANGLDSVLVQNFIYNDPQVLEELQAPLHRTGPMMQLLSELWGNYPFAKEKYGHAQAPMGGGMEHQTLSTMGHFSADIVAHELAHHWFGNNVTCATWSDIWINEGFATYAEMLAREFLVGEESARLWLQATHASVKSMPDGSVFIPPIELTNIWRIFNGRLSYRKGASILHQLRFELDNDALFFTVMQQFQDDFADSVATGDDFRAVLDFVTQESWSWFFDQWYYGEGYPVYDLYWHQEGGSLFIRSSQKTSSPFTEFFAGALEFKVVTEEKEYFFRVFQDEILQDFEFAVDEKVIQIIFDPRGFMLMDYSITDSTHIDPAIYSSISIAPNPFTESITLTYPERWYRSRLVIADLQGRALADHLLVSQPQQIALSSLSAGLYTLTVYSPYNEKFVYKIMKL